MKEQANFYNWQGVDASLDISLFEYGFIACKREGCEPDQMFVLYKTPYADDDGKKLYGCGYISESELNALVNGEDWMNSDDCESFLSTMGMTRQDWLKLDFIIKFSDLSGYFGMNNFLEDYPPQPLSEYKFPLPQEILQGEE